MESLTGIHDETSELPLVSLLGTSWGHDGISNMEKWKHRVDACFAIKLPHTRISRLSIRDYRQVLVIINSSECTMSHHDRLR